MSPPLSNLIVVEVSDTAPAAFACSLLADYGANVTIIEPYPHGSPVRTLCPSSAQEAWWQSIARGKSSHSVVFSDAASLDTARQKLLSAEVIVTDVPRQEFASHPLLNSLQQTADRKTSSHPTLLHIIPTGKDQPDTWPLPMNARFTTAYTGLAALTGEVEGAPVVPEFPLADAMCGALAVTALMAELVAEKRRGRVPHNLTIASHEAILRMIEWQLPVATATGKVEARCGNSFPMNAGIGNMPKSKDGKYFAYSAANQAVALRLLRLIGSEAMASDPRFSTHIARERHMPLIHEAIDKWAAKYTREEALELARQADVVMGPIFGAQDILRNEHTLGRESVIATNTSKIPGNNQQKPFVTKTVPAAFHNEHERAKSLPPWWEAPELKPPLYAANVDAESGNTQVQLPARDGPTRIPTQRHSETVNTTPPEEPEKKDKSDLPLAGIIVVELGTIIAGPFAGSLLTDLGATVIKVEAPGEGDGLRKMGPRVNGIPLWWGVTSRSKKNVSLNLKSHAGRAAVEKLIAKADVVIENFRPGVMDRLGIGAQRLFEINPHLVMLSVSGFGQTGPYANRPGFGKIAESMSGMLPFNGRPATPPLFVGFSLADTSAGAFGALAINVALYALAERKAVHIDLALYEPLLRTLDTQLRLSSATRRGSNDPYGWGQESTYSLPMVECNDRKWLQVLLPDEGAVRKATTVLECPPLTYQAGGSIVRCSRYSAEEARLQLANCGISATHVMNALDIAQNSYFQKRGDVVWTEVPSVGQVALPGFFPREYHSPDREAFRSVGVGHDNETVFREILGLSDSQIAELLEECSTSVSIR